jgi:hypothetical protein
MVDRRGLGWRGKLRGVARGQLSLERGDVVFERVKLTDEVVNFRAQLFLRFPAAIPEDVNKDK